MKFRMMLSALLLAAGLVFVNTGCGKKAEKTAEKKAATPTDVAKKFSDCLKKMDFDAAAAFCDGKMQEDVKNGAKQFAEMKEKAAKGDEQAKQVLAEVEKNSNAMKIEFKGEKIEGDYAVVETVTTNPDGKTNEETTYLKKVNGEWKLITKADYKPAK